MSVFLFFIREQRQVTVKGWGEWWKEGEGVAFQWESWRKEMGVESAFEGERLSLCLKKKTIVKGKCRASGGRALWKGKAWVSGYYALLLLLLLLFLLTWKIVWTSKGSVIYIYIYIDDNMICFNYYFQLKWYIF